MQVKAYGGEAALSGGGLRPRRLLVWEGRRRGVPGVGWGAGALIGDAVGQGTPSPSLSPPCAHRVCHLLAVRRAAIRDKARKRAEEEGRVLAAAVASDGFSGHKHRDDVSSGAGGKEAEPEPAPQVCPARPLAHPPPSSRCMRVRVRIRQVSDSKFADEAPAPAPAAAAAASTPPSASAAASNSKEADEDDIARRLEAASAAARCACVWFGLWCVLTGCA